MGERPADEGAAFRPALRVQLKTGIGAVPEECGDGDVGDADVAEQETAGGDLLLEIVDRGRNIGLLGLVDPGLVAGLKPDQRTDDLLVEIAPDQQVAEACVGIFLEPPCLCPIARIAREQGMSRIGLVQIGTDDRRIAGSEIAIDQDRDAPEGA